MSKFEPKKQIHRHLASQFDNLASLPNFSLERLEHACAVYAFGDASHKPHRKNAAMQEYVVGTLVKPWLQHQRDEHGDRVFIPRLTSVSQTRAPRGITHWMHRDQATELERVLFCRMCQENAEKAARRAGREDAAFEKKFGRTTTEAWVALGLPV